MSKIQRIFNKNSDSDSSDFEESDFSDLDDYNEEEEQDDDQNDEEENVDEEKNDDDEEEENEYEENEDYEDEHNDEEEDEENEEEIEEDDEKSEGSDDDYEDMDSDNDEEDKEESFKKIKSTNSYDNYKNIQRVQEKKLYNNIQVRENGKKMISKYCSDKEMEKLEKSLFNYCVRSLKEKFPSKAMTVDSKEFKNIYCFEIYSIMSHFKAGKDADDIRDYYLQDTSHFDRETFKKERINDQKKLRLITHVSEPVSGIHTCKCGCDKVYSYELQLRSGDEGMTVFLQCFSCGRKWKL